ncbi:ADP-ribosyltransferase [Bacillus thuringiensis]|uniref:ADP-ribosyltransferase n=1 Tax=Bacillus thuringiensis TaxID=1428 RepID=UPI003459ABB5
MLHKKKIIIASVLSFGLSMGVSVAQPAFAAPTYEKLPSDGEQEWQKSLTDEEKEAIRDYTCYGYHWINNYLRPNTGSNRDTNLDMKISNIDNALRKASISTDIIVYKHLESGKSLGLDFEASKNDKEYIKKAINILKNNINKIIIRPDYLSTTLDKTGKEIKLGGKIRMEINVPKGTHAANVSEISFFPREQEILLPRNSKIKIRDVSTTTEEGSEIIILKVDLIP